MKNQLAFDLGASNGRAVLGQLEDGKLAMRELHRFENNYIFGTAFSNGICPICWIN